MKVSSKIYKGIEYVRLIDLPADQVEKFALSMNEDSIIKIMIDGTIVKDCVVYREYETWFDSTYPKSKVAASSRKAVPQEEVAEIAFNGI